MVQGSVIPRHEATNGFLCAEPSTYPRNIRRLDERDVIASVGMGAVGLATFETNLPMEHLPPNDIDPTTPLTQRMRQRIRVGACWCVQIVG